MTPEITLQYVPREFIGYGRMGLSIATALTAAGVDVYDAFDPPSLEDHPEMVSYNGKRTKRTNVVCWLSVPGHAFGWYTGQHNSLLSMWEATKLPEVFRENFFEFDTVIVPSKHNVELFSQYHDNVRLVLLGVDPERWHYIERTPPDQYFDFLIGGSGKRKGTDLAFEAFTKVFGTPPKHGPIPRLIMKNPKGEPFHHDRVEVLAGRLTMDEETGLYARSHCYVQPSRGEGFGLQPLQAMAQGMPTILTDAHGHEAFAKLGYPIGYDLAPSEYFIYGDAGDWWEPSLADLCEQMWTVYHEYDHALRKGKMAAQVVAENFTWANTAEQFIAAYDGELGRPYSGDGSWHKAEVRKFLAITTRDWRAEIAGTLYQLTRGREYYLLADVKRILFEAGVLDPRCIDIPGDSGLTDKQIAELPEYRRNNSHCRECRQPLGGRTRDDEIFEQLERDAKWRDAIYVLLNERGNAAIPDKVSEVLDW